MSWNEGTGLRLNFTVDNVLCALEKNKAEHEKIFKEAEEGYKQELRKELSEKLDCLAMGKFPNPHSKLVRPVNHLEEYDTAIEMLRLTTDEAIQLTQDQFKCYMLNKWSWSGTFLHTNAAYSSIAAAAVGSAPGASFSDDELAMS